MNDILTKLLDHLGMKVMKQDDAFVLVEKHNDAVVECYVKWSHTTIGWAFSKYRDCKELANALLNDITLFYMRDALAFLNPCYGCKSLEEAMIKIDLNPKVKNLLNDKVYHNIITFMHYGGE